MKKNQKLAKKVKFDRKNIAILAGLLAVAGIYIIYRASAGGWTQADIRVNGQFVKAIDIGAGARKVWALGEDKALYERVGTTWTKLADGSLATRIDVDDRGLPWRVDPEGKIWRMLSDRRWEVVPMGNIKAKDIGVSAYGAGANAVGTNNCLYRYSLETMARVREVECSVGNVESYSGRAYWTSGNKAYSGRYEGGGFPITSYGTTGIRDLARGGNSQLWGVSTRTTTGGYSPYAWRTVDGKLKWVNMYGGATRLSIESSGHVWSVNNSGHIYHRDYN